MENQEEVHDVLTLFEKKPSADIPQILEDYLKAVAKTGKTLFPWNRIKALFITKVEQVMDQFNQDVPYDHLPLFPNVENTKYIEMHRRIKEAMERFTGAPFTVQRICELVTQPRKHYTRCDKFLRGIEKNVMVVSTVDPFGRKIVSESTRMMVNGLDTNGFQKGDFNDFTEGQPFGPILQSSWSNNNSASIWPIAGVLDNVDSLQKLSATAAGATLDPNINAANPQVAMPTSSGEITSSEKFSETPVPSNISSDSSGFSALFQEKPLENEHVSCPAGLQSLSGAQGTDPVKEEGEESMVEEEECNASADSEQQQLNSEAGASGEESSVVHEQSQQEDEVSSQDKQVPPDPIDTTSPDDEGPPEKKQRQEEEEPVEEKASPEAVTSETSEESAPVQSTEEPQSTSDESEQTTPESSTECNENIQESDDSEVSQSDTSIEPHTKDSTTDEQTTAPVDDQSAVTSTEDSEQATHTEQAANTEQAEHTEQKEHTEDTVLSDQTDSCVDKESNGENEPESSVEDVKAENQEENNEVDSEVSADIGETDSGKVEVNECDVSKEEEECSSSATEMMETDTVTEEKSQTDIPETTEEAMEQD